MPFAIRFTAIELINNSRAGKTKRYWATHGEWAVEVTEERTKALAPTDVELFTSMEAAKEFAVNFYSRKWAGLALSSEILEVKKKMKLVPRHVGWQVVRSKPAEIRAQKGAK